MCCRTKLAALLLLLSQALLSDQIGKLPSPVYATSLRDSTIHNGVENSQQYSSVQSQSMPTSLDKQQQGAPTSNGSQILPLLHHRPNTMMRQSSSSIPSSQNSANFNPSTAVQITGVPSYANPQFNDSIRSNLDSYTRIEGSGDGPLPEPRHHNEKLDDTEDGDDDDEDYDYRDGLETGSGQGNEPSTSNKTEFLSTNQTIKPLEADHDNKYLPFRPPSVGDISTLTTNSHLAQSPRYTSPKPSILPPLEVQTVSANSSKPKLSSTGPIGAYPSQRNDNRIPSYEIASTLTTPSTYATKQTLEAINNIQPSTTEPNQTTTSIFNIPSSTVAPRHLLVKPVNQPTNFTSSPINFDFQNSNNSFLSRPNGSISSDIDYEYEDDSEDEDSEDTSNFEDNEPSDGDITVKATNAPVPTSPMNIIVPNLKTDSLNVTTATPTPKVILASTEVPNQSSTSTLVNFIQSTSNYQKPGQSPYTTIGPQRLPSEQDYRGEEDGSNEDEDDEDEDEDEEEIEEEVDEENESPEVSSSTFSVPRWTPRPSMIPTSREIIEEHYKMSKNISPFITTPTPFIRPNDVPSTARPATTTRSISTMYSVPTSTYSSTFKSMASTKATTPQPVVASMPATTARVTQTRLTTTPLYKAIPPITRTSNVFAFDRSLRDDDMDLTRQVYDKAVELYHATSKAIHTAVETFWPPTVDFNASTFEPLLAQPLLFMCKYLNNLALNSTGKFIG